MAPLGSRQADGQAGVADWHGRPHLRLLTTAALLLLAAASAPTAAAPGPTLQATLPRWVDGGTAVVHVAGSGRTTARLIGIDAPEASLSPRASDQARRLGVPVQHILLLGRAARNHASTLAPPGSTVRLELDVQTHDRYGGLLAYMRRPDGRMVNEELLRQGWALLLTVPPDVRHAHRLAPPSTKHVKRHWACGADSQPGPTPPSATPAIPTSAPYRRLHLIWTAANLTGSTETGTAWDVRVRRRGTCAPLSTTVPHPF